jgi:diguanylate cyclase (GGDEF)-like protein
LKREIFLAVAGEPRYFEASISDLHDNRRITVGRLMLLRDVTERKQYEQKLKLLAVTDPLTGIFNRRHFFTLAEREWQRSRRAGGPLSIILFDVDHFKAVNDTYGHRVGDQVLQTLTQRCKTILRAYDVIGRYGGEEFVILLPETSISRASQVGERLRSAVAEPPFETSAGPARVTISVGVACLEPPAELSLDKLIDQADLAIYEAKRRGRDQVFT